MKFLLTFKLTKPAEQIFDCLTDVNKFVSVHPIINRIDALGDNQYFVYESLKLGFIPYSFTYPATIERNIENKTITINATIMKLTKVELVFKISQHASYSLVEETITFRSPLPVKSIMKKVFTEQHQKLFKNIEDL
jgi:carbon monoxide dehydrogenase subunit G